MTGTGGVRGRTEPERLRRPAAPQRPRRRREVIGDPSDLIGRDGSQWQITQKRRLAAQLARKPPAFRLSGRE
jgi:hypothetical protein